MTALAEYETRVRALCLGDEPAPGSAAQLGDDEWRWFRYRRMVRRRLFDVVEHAFPRFEAAVGRQTLETLFDRFLEAGGPRSPFLRDVPGELLDWLVRTDAAGDVSTASMDLARYEWARLEASYAADGPIPEAGSELSMTALPVLLRAHRLLGLSHAVQRTDSEGLAPEPTFLCVYRDPATSEVKTLELSPAAHALLERLARGDTTLASAIESAAARVGAPLDRGFLEATSAVLADFVERGLLLAAVPGAS